MMQTKDIEVRNKKYMGSKIPAVFQDTEYLLFSAHGKSDVHVINIIASEVIDNFTNFAKQGFI